MFYCVFLCNVRLCEFWCNIKRLISRRCVGDERRMKLVNRYHFLYIMIVSNCHIPDLIPPIVTEHEYYKKRNKNLRSIIIVFGTTSPDLSVTQCAAQKCLFLILFYIIYSLAMLFITSLVHKYTYCLIYLHFRYFSTIYE